MKNNQLIEFFGYGADRDPEMMKAIIGRVPKGYPATLEGFELCVQTWEEIPEEAKKILSPPWDSSFSSYILRPTLKPFKKVRGTIWLITPHERKLIDNWELVGKWYQVFFLHIRTHDDLPKQIEIQVVNDQKIKKVVHGEYYKNFITSKSKMLDLAEKVRKDYLHNN